MSTGLAFYQRVFGPARKQKRVLDRHSLPTPLAYLKKRRLLVRRTRSESGVITCPSHKRGEEVHPSMLVSLIDGHFKCMACGAKGGDIIDLHQLITGLRFEDAVADLGGQFHD
jgi:DNA primase